MTNQTDTERSGLLVVLMILAHVSSLLASGSDFFASGMLPPSVLGDEDEHSWIVGPFVKRKQPVLQPTSDSRFQCPIRGEDVRWEAQNVYNPAAVVRRGKVYLLYRADDKSPDLKWGRTCRIGLAWSEDGIHFSRRTKPVLYPDNDLWKEYEWEGGGEDLHIVEGEDGIFLMFNGADWDKTSPSRGAWTLGQALIDRHDMMTVLKHQDKPFLYPERDWEKVGFTGLTTVANGLVHFKGQWFLYYGAADRVIGLATCTKRSR